MSKETTVLYCNRSELGHSALLIAVLLVATLAVAQDRTRGTATITTDDSEYIVPIECNDALKPELGFSTEPSRITREETGRTSGVRVTLRPWQETAYLVVSLDRYVAWIPTEASTNGVLSLTLDMSPASTVVDGVPRALTYDDWMAGNRPAGIQGVSIRGDCRSRNSDAPAYRKLP